PAPETVPPEIGMYVERDDPGDVGCVRVAQGKTAEIAVGFGEHAARPGKKQKPLHLPAGVRNSRLEAQAVEGPEARKVIRSGVSEDRFDPGGGRFGVTHRESDPSLDCAAMPAGRVVSLYVAAAAGARMDGAESVRAIAGRGIE